MPKLIVQVWTSVDGYVAPRKGAPEHRGTPADAALKQRKLAWLQQTGTHVMGRVTYEQMAQVWPTSNDPYAAPMNQLPKVVFSKTLARADWAGSRIARGELTDEITALKEEPGGDIVAWGGATFLQSLSRAGLVDEYRVTINPVAFGDGLLLFKDLPAPLRLELVEATAYGNGAVLHLYRPSR